MNVSSKQPAAPLPSRHWERIAEIWRGRIGRRPWTPGSRLPANAEIAREFGVSTGRAQQALQMLKREGLLERVPGRGTVVSSRAAVVAAQRDAAARPARRVGVLFNDYGPISPYAVRFAHLLCGELGRRGVDARLRLFNPALPDVEKTLADDIRATGFAALFVLGTSDPRERLSALRLPVPLLSHGPLRHVAYAPDLTLWDEIADVLARHGVRRPAFASNLRPEVAALAFAPDGLRDIPSPARTSPARGRRVSASRCSPAAYARTFRSWPTPFRRIRLCATPGPSARRRTPRSGSSLPLRRLPTRLSSIQTISFRAPSPPCWKAGAGRRATCFAFSTATAAWSRMSRFPANGFPTTSPRRPRAGQIESRRFSTDGLFRTS